MVDGLLNRHGEVLEAPSVHLQTESITLNEEQLLEFYLSLSLQKRSEAFASTARAAEIAGLSQRTIQFWIEVGAIRALCVGRRYQVSLDSLKAYLRAKADRQAI